MSELTRSGLRAPALEPLLAGLVDYAGTFPPAGLALEAAAANFARYRRSPQAWILGRAAVAQGDLVALASWVREHDAGTGLWPITAVVGDRWDRTAELVEAASAPGRTLDVQAFECRVASADQVAGAVAALAPLAATPTAAPTDVIVEVPADRPADWPPLLDAIAAAGARAKLRTGAIVAAAIPPADVVARFLVACAGRKLPVKLTAGLHHALCATRALTYEPAGPIGPMHGFVNAYAAAGLAFGHLLAGAGAGSATTAGTANAATTNATTAGASAVGGNTAGANTTSTNTAGANTVNAAAAQTARAAEIATRDARTADTAASDAATVERCLRAGADAFRATEHGLEIALEAGLDGAAPLLLDTAHLHGLRARWIGAFGSCSFDEPLDDLCVLGWLEHPAR